MGINKEDGSIHLYCAKHSTQEITEAPCPLCIQEVAKKMLKDSHKMNILMITPWNARCGIFTYSRELANALAQHDIDVYIMRLPRFGVKTPELLQDIADRIPVKGIDLIHCQHEYGLYQSLEGGFFGALKQLDIPVVTTMHATGNFEIDRVIYDVSDKIIVHNEFCKRGFDTDKTVVIPHGCKKPIICPPKEVCRAAHNIPAQTLIVGYCGFISNYKGLEVLIKAMTRIPDAALLIAGGWHLQEETAYINQLKALTNSVLHKRCQWIGYVPDEQLSLAYGAMDVVCYCSKFASESGALLMAMSHGKPVIASSLPPFREKEREGALITFKTEDDLVSKIDLLLKDMELRDKLERGAKDYSYKNRWEVVAEKHINLYREILYL